MFHGEPRYNYNGPIVGILANGQPGLLRPSCLDGSGLIILSGIAPRPRFEEITTSSDFWQKGATAPMIGLQDWSFANKHQLAKLHELVIRDAILTTDDWFCAHKTEVFCAETEAAKAWKLFYACVSIDTQIMALSYVKPDTAATGQLLIPLDRYDQIKAFSLRFDVRYDWGGNEILHKLYFQFRPDTTYGREFLFTEWRYGHPLASLRLYPDTDTILSDDLEKDDKELLERIRGTIQK